MAWRSSAPDAFRTTFFSGWGILLALAFVIRPAVLAGYLLLDPSAFRGLGGFGGGEASPTAYAVAILAQASGGAALPVLVLVAMVAAGAWGPAASPPGAFLGRAGALLAILAAAWLVPSALIAASRAGGAAIYPSLLHFAIVALELLAWTALLCVLAELRLRVPGVGAAALWLVLGVAVAEVRVLLLGRMFPGISERAAEVWAWSSFLSPDGVATALRSTTFPRYGMFFVDPDLLPGFFTPLTFALAALAWIVVPFLVLVMGERRSSAEDAIEA